MAWAVLTIASAGFFALVYLAALRIIPYAETSEERAEAYGLPFNAQELIDQARKHYSNFKKDSEEWWLKFGKGEWNDWKRNIQNMHFQVRRQPGGHGTRPGRRAGGRRVLHQPQTLVSTDAVFGWPVPVGVPLWAGMLVLVVLYTAVVGPFKAAFRGWHPWQSVCCPLSGRNHQKTVS